MFIRFTWNRDFFKEFEENDELIQLISLKKSPIKGTAKCLQAIQDKLNSKKNIMLLICLEFYNAHE